MSLRLKIAEALVLKLTTECLEWRVSLHDGTHYPAVVITKRPDKYYPQKPLPEAYTYILVTDTYIATNCHRTLEQRDRSHVAVLELVDPNLVDQIESLILANFEYRIPISSYWPRCKEVE